MIFKTTITDINKMAVAIDKISTMTLPNYSGLGTAIEGLTAKQTALVLSTRNLSQAELEEVVIQNDLISKYGAGQLVKEGLLSANSSLLISEKAISAEKLKESITQSALNKEKAEEFIQKQLIVAANGEEASTTIILNKALMDETVKRGILSKEKAEEILSTYGVIAADKLEIGSKNGLVKAIGGVIAANASLIASTVGISALIFVLGKLSKVSDEVKNKAEDLGNSFKGTISDIDGYQTKIEELHKTIHNSNSSIEEVINARQTLMSVQDELIEKYGTEKETIELITSTINNQSDAFDKLIQKKRQETLNEFDDTGFWNGVANWIEGYDSNIDRMKSKMEDVRQILSFSTKDFDSNQFTELEQLLNKRGWKYQETLGGFVKNGNLKEVYSELLEIQNLAKDIKVPDSFLKDLTKDANEAKETISEYGEVWDAYILENRIFSDENLADTWHKVNEAFSNYQKAFATGNQEEIEKSLSVYSDLLSSVLNDSDVDDSVKEYFSSMYPALQAEVEKWEFRAKILPKFDTRALNGKTKSDILQMLQEDGFQYGEQTFNSTLRLASEYGIITGTNSEKVQQLLDLLVEWGILQDDINDTASEYGNRTGISPLSISHTIDQLNTQLKPAFDSLQSAYQDIFTDDGKFALNSIDILSTCDTIKSKLDEMSDPEGLNLDVDYSAFEDFVRVLNNTESTEQDVENAFDSLATSITQAALTGAEDFETMKAALEDLGVVNNEMVAFDNLISKTNALADAGIDLANATEAEMQAFVDESVSAENAGEALALLHLKKALVNQETITTAKDCQNILDLATAANVGIAYLEQLNTLMNLITKRDAAHASGDSRAVSELNRAIHDFSANIVNNLNLEGLQVDFSGLGKGAKPAGKKAGKDYKDALKEQLSDLDSVISGITGRIDDQISSINEQKSAALESIDAQKEALEEAKDVAVEALEAERDARLEVIETQKKQLEEQIKLIDKQIKSKQDEIDAINDAADARKRELDLQKAQYELERMQNQRTILQYSEDKGMHYVNDTKGIRDAKEVVDDAKRQIEIANIQKEIDLLEDQKDLLNEQIDLLDERADAINKYYDEQIKQTEKFYDAQIKALEKQRKSTESYFESLITNLENSKSKYQELTEILEKAELSAKLKQLGIDEEALLNGSEEEFNKLKDAYMNIVFQLNQGNDEVLSSLRELSGYEGTAPSMLEDSNGKLDEMNGRLNTSNQTIGTVNSSLGETAVKTSDAATNVSDLNENLSQINTIISEEQTAFDTLRQKIDEIITAINEKIVATYTGQAATAIATTTEMACYMLLRDKILEVKEHLDAVSNTAITLDVAPVNALTTAFQLLYDQLLLVSTTLGAGMEGAEEGAVGGITSAINALNEISLEEGIIAQFTNLKTAIDEVTSAIGGGGGGDSEGSVGGEGSGGKSGGGQSGGKGSKGEGGGGNSLTGAIESMGETAAEVIGEPDAEGDGTVIGEFGALETAVTDVTSAIGGGESEGGEGQGKGSGSEGEDGEGTLIGSIENLGETTEEVLGEPGGEGVIGRFEKFKEPIQEAETHVKGISTGLDEIDGKEVECTIKVNIEVSGSTGFTGSAKVLGSMNLNSAEYNAKYTGASHAEGTAMVSGNWAVQSDEQNALVGEVGRELIVRGGRFFTVGDNGAEMFDIKKGDIVFNHEQTEDLLKHGHISGRGKAYADGTVGGGKILTKDSSILRPLQPGDKMYDLVQKFDAYFKSIDGNLEKLVPNSFYEQNREWNKLADQITYANSVVNNNKNQPVTVNQNVTLNCPNLTNNSGVEYVQKQLGHLSLKAYQEPLGDY